MRPRLDFFVGMPRSGSTWLGAQLDRHPDLAVFGETSFFGRAYVPPGPDGNYGPTELERLRSVQRARHWAATTGSGQALGLTEEGWGACVDEAIDGLSGRARPEDAFVAIASAVARASGVTRVIEKTPHHVRFVDQLISATPGARFVATRREPYGFVRSMHHLADRQARTGAGARWENLSRHPLLGALLWRRYDAAIQALVQRYPERVLVIDLEAIRSDPGAVLDRVSDFLELTPLDAPGEVAENSSFAGDAPQPSPDEVLWVNVLLGSRLGAARRPSPPMGSAVLRSMTLAPLAAISAGQNLLAVRNAWRYLRGR